jgi:hypothetical protein
MEVEGEGNSSSLTTISSSKRARKLKWPNLRGRKTEDLNKFWIRKFRSYMRKNTHLLFGVRDPTWWEDFMDRRKEPGNRRAPFSSYNKKFKKHLKSNDEYLKRV